MLHLRRCISVVAALGMLAHAAALTRHKTAMLGAAVQLSKLAADLARICHGGDNAGLAGDRLPRPADGQVNCPICAGLGPPFIDVATQKTSLANRLAPVPAPPPMGERREVMRLALRPPVRGPPAPIPSTCLNPWCRPAVPQLASSLQDYSHA
jgi:hypothetical protein